jgi:hypothetical protein
MAKVVLVVSSSEIARLLIGSVVVGGEALEQGVQVLPGVVPAKWPGGEVVATSEGHQPVLDVGQIVEVVRAEDFPLHDGEEYVVQPGGVYWQVNQLRVAGQHVAAPVARVVPSMPTTGVLAWGTPL